MNKRRIIVAYIFLVGGPLLGLVGILRAGTHLSAPWVVRGNWIVETDFNLWHNLPCQALLTSAWQPFLSIVQAGRNLTITLNNPEKMILTGTIGGSTFLTVSSLASDKNGSASREVGSCRNLPPLRLEAQVNDLGKERWLQGSISMDGCAKCSPLPFRAIRQGSDKGAR